MATPDSRNPKHAAHFGAQGNGRGTDLGTGAMAPVPASPSATAPHAALKDGRVSKRTAAATKRAGSHMPKDPHGSHGRKVPLALVAGVLAVVVAVIAGIVFVPGLLPGGEDKAPEVELAEPGTEVTITIPEGSGAGVVAQTLYENGLISDQSEFLAEVRRTEAEQRIKSGSYLIVAGTDASQIIELLTMGPNASTAQLIVPEGYTVKQIATAAEENLGISAEDFLAQAKASNYAADYSFLAGVDPSYDSLEGYLFPKTYDFSGDENLTADTVIRAMLDQYEIEVVPLDLAAAATTLSERYGIQLNENDVLTMASIIEREAVTDEQRAKIASVFYNRLRDGMRLQSDATLTYSLGRAATADEINTLDDPYNTNLRDGLTPTPVCSPSLASIKAACEPADTNYFYFFITQDTEQFSETYDEHMQAYS